jgi:hypothetical protein
MLASKSASGLAKIVVGTIAVRTVSLSALKQDVTKLSFAVACQCQSIRPVASSNARIGPCRSFYGSSSRRFNETSLVGIRLLSGDLQATCRLLMPRCTGSLPVSGISDCGIGFGRADRSELRGRTTLQRLDYGQRLSHDKEQRLPESECRQANLPDELRKFRPTWSHLSFPKV